MLNLFENFGFLRKDFFIEALNNLSYSTSPGSYPELVELRLCLPSASSSSSTVSSSSSSGEIYLCNYADAKNEPVLVDMFKQLVLINTITVQEFNMKCSTLRNTKNFAKKRIINFFKIFCNYNENAKKFVLKEVATVEDIIAVLRTFKDLEHNDDVCYHNLIRLGLFRVSSFATYLFYRIITIYKLLLYDDHDIG